MKSISPVTRGIQAAAISSAILVAACQAQTFGPGLGTSPQTNLAPMVMAGQDTQTQAVAQPFLPCNGVRMPRAGGTPVPFVVAPARKGQAFSPRVGTPYLYIADEYGSQIDIFPSDGRDHAQVGTITAGVELPYGIWFDRRSQSLYVANQENYTVTAYPYGSSQPSVTYSQDLNRPLFPIVDRHGDLYVSNANDGTVVEYLAGSTKAHAVLQTPGVEADGLAFDRHGDLYVAYRTCPSGDGSIEEFAPGSTHGQVLGMSLSDPQGLVVDSSGNIVVDETGTASERVELIEVFPPGATTPSMQVQMPGQDLPIELALDCNEKHLYVASLFKGAALAATYPLASQRLFLKEQVSAVVQGVTITNNAEF